MGDSLTIMLPPMKKAMKAGGAKAMSKGALLKAISTELGLKTKTCSNVLNSLVTVGAKEVKKNGVFTVPNICRIKTRTKPATKAGVRMCFGKETKSTASKDHREGFPSCRTEEADLNALLTSRA